MPWRLTVEGRLTVEECRSGQKLKEPIARRKVKMKREDEERRKEKKREDEKVKRKSLARQWRTTMAA